MASASQTEQQGNATTDIPVRKVVVHDPNQLPLDYGTTPGGTIFSTTPGGTRIVYERKFLLQCRNSPHSMSPPCNLPTIPGVTEPEENGDGEKTQALPGQSTSARASTPKENIAPGEVRKSQERSGDGMFDMDM